DAGSHIGEDTLARYGGRAHKFHSDGANNFAFLNVELGEGWLEGGKQKENRQTGGKRPKKYCHKSGCWVDDVGKDRFSLSLRGRIQEIRQKVKLRFWFSLGCWLL
ncbi:MAG: hypothetical protein SNJ52_05300, partial [Verrucomicrobiia bacterium]